VFAFNKQLFIFSTLKAQCQNPDKIAKIFRFSSLNKRKTEKSQKNKESRKTGKIDSTTFNRWTATRRIKMDERNDEGQTQRSPEVSKILLKWRTEQISPGIPSKLVSPLALAQRENYNNKLIILIFSR
jgi:hypothetical protein